jgi:hypothetical protein
MDMSVGCKYIEYEKLFIRLTLDEPLRITSSYLTLAVSPLRTVFLGPATFFVLDILTLFWRQIFSFSTLARMAPEAEEMLCDRVTRRGVIASTCNCLGTENRFN